MKKNNIGRKDWVLVLCFMVSAIFVASLSGCSSIARFIDDDSTKMDTTEVEYVHAESISDRKYDSDAERYLEEVQSIMDDGATSQTYQAEIRKIIEDGTNLTNRHVNDLGIEVSHDIKVMQVADNSETTMQVVFKVIQDKEHEAFFAPGVYDVKKSKETQVFLMHVENTLNEVYQSVKNRGQMSVAFSVYGSADGLKVKDGLNYKGEYGDVLELKEDELFSDGEFKSKLYYEGMSLTNEDLAISAIFKVVVAFDYLCSFFSILRI